MKNLLLLCLLCAGVKMQGQSLKAGQWQGLIEYEHEDVPFEFSVENTKDGLVITIQNGDEQLQIENATISGDSITIPLKPFDAWLKAKISDHTLEGYWKKGYRTKGLPFSASYGTPRFERSSKKGVKKFIGKWQIEFTPPSSQPYPGVLMVAESNGLMTGTFLTEVGDFRYFKGVVRNDSLLMSSFDGAHAFLFKGLVYKENITGSLTMDRTYSEALAGVKNDEASIPIPFKEVEPGHRPYFDILSAGDPGVKIDADKYFNKVLVLQLFGTWCPNSMDQTYFLREWHKSKPENVEVLAVTFEPNFSTAYGNQRIENYQSAMGLPYPISLGGELSKGQAALALPYEDKINAFPTLVLVDKEGFIRYEFSYFNGPATGEYHQAFVDKFNESINMLASE